MARYGWHESLKNWRGIVAIVGGILIHVAVGSFYAYGNMVPYIVSYCRLRGNTPHLSYQSTSYVLSAMSVGMSISVPVGGWLERKMGVRRASFIGCALFSLSLLVSAWTISVSFYFLLFTYGLLSGLGLGIAYTPPIVCVMKWFPNSKGLASGCVLTGLGLGTFIIDFVQSSFINPHNLATNVRIGPDGASQMFYDQESILERVPMSFIVQAIMLAIIQLIGVAMLQDPPDMIKRTRRCAVRRKQRIVDEKSGILMIEPSSKADVSPDDKYKTSSTIEAQPSTSSNGGHASISSDVETSDDGGTWKRHEPNGGTMTEVVGDHDERWSGKTVAPSQIFKDVFFWQLVALFFLDNVATIYISSLYKAFGETFIGDDAFLTAAGSISSLFNAAGRIFWGLIADKFSFKVSFMTLSAVMAALILTFPFSVFGNKPFFFIWVCGIFFSIGGVFSTAPTAMARACGAEFVGINYGFVFLFGFGISSLVASSIQQVLFVRVSWVVLLIVIGMFPAISVIIAIFVNVKTPDGHDI